MRDARGVAGDFPSLQNLWIAAASQILGQRSQSRGVSSRNTSSLARSGNMKSPVSGRSRGQNDEGDAATASPS